MFIGQPELISHIDKLINDNNFPRFSLVNGRRKSGKKTLITYIKSKINAEFIVINKDIESIREMISTSYKTNDKILYFIEDLETAHPNAIDSLLKVFEECPQNAYFIATFTDNLLETIINRAVVFKIGNYSKEELESYAKKYEVDEDKIYLILRICDTIGEIEEIINTDFRKMWEYSSIVLENIGKSSIGNTLKISGRISFKGNESDKFNLNYFIKCLELHTLDKFLQTKNEIFYEIMCLILKMRKEVRINSVNKQFIFDYFLLEMRNALMS